MEVEKAAEMEPSYTLQRKRSKLRRAVVFFKCFGRWTSSKSGNPPLSIASGADQTGSSPYGLDQKAELEDVSLNTPSHPEIGDSSIAFGLLDHEQARDAHPRAELHAGISAHCEMSVPAHERSAELSGQNGTAELYGDNAMLATSHLNDQHHADQDRHVVPFPEDISPISRPTSSNATVVSPLFPTAHFVAPITYQNGRLPTTPDLERLPANRMSLPHAHFATSMTSPNTHLTDQQHSGHQGMVSLITDRFYGQCGLIFVLQAFLSSI